jgi:hypothetical protein
MSKVIPTPITPPPGVVATESDRIVEGRWILPWGWFRFMKGLPQKMGGWIQAFAAATSGIPHCILAWTDLMINRFLAAGTYSKLYVYDQNGLQNDITPIRLSSTGIGGGANLTNPFSTTAGSSIIYVTQTSHGVGIGDQVIYVSVGSGVGGITAAQLQGAFLCVASVAPNVDDANHFSFDCGTVASSTAGPGGGTVTYLYEITVGSENAAFGLGWGVGTWGGGTWGSPRSGSTVVFEARVWAMDHFGKLLMASYNGAPTIWYFDPTQLHPWGGVSLTNPRAISVGPDLTAALAGNTIRSVFVTPERFVIALCENLVVLSCSQGEYTIWSPATNNTAWSRTMTDGSKLMGGSALAPFQSLIWTDGAVYLFQWTGDAFIYRSSLIGKDCGLIGTNANICTGGIAYWMTPSNFMMYDGSVHPMPNVEDIRKYVFDNINITQTIEISAGYNPIYDEVWFNIPLFGSSTPNTLIVFHRVDNCWTIHQNVTRVSMSNFVNGDNRPYLGDVNGFIYQHEIGNDNGSGTGVSATLSPITSTITLSPYALQEGLHSMDIEGILWDFFQQSGPVSATVNTFDRLTDLAPMDTETETVPATQAGLTDYRLSGRYVGFTLTQNALGAYMRLGKPAAFIKPSGVRR